MPPGTASAERLGSPRPSTTSYPRASADPSAAYLFARIVTALLGTLTVAVTYLLGRVAYDRRVGAVAAVLLAGTFLHARQSHFAVNDVPATLLTTLAVAGCVLVLRRGAFRHYVIAGLAIGAAAATKYSGLAAALPLVLAHGWSESSPPSDWLRRVVDRRLLAAGAAALIVFLVAVPFSVIDRGAFVDDVMLLYERGQTGFKGLRLAENSGWVFYLKTLRWGMGLPYLLVALASVVAALVRHRRVDLVVVSFPLLLYLYLGRQLLLFERFVLPALPVLAVLTGVLLWRLVDRTGWSARTKATAIVVAAALLLVAPVSNTLRFDWLLTQPDTRTLAKDWIEENVPEGARVLAHSNGPQLAGGDRRAPNANRPFDVTYVGTTSLGKEPLQAVRDAGHEYVVVSSFSYDRRMLDAEEDAKRLGFYEQLDGEAIEVRQFRPDTADRPIPFAFAHIYGPATDLWALENPGPTIKVYRLELAEP